MLFNRLTIALLPFVIHAIVGAAVLWARAANRMANRWLAALIVVMALRTLPYVLGFAGAYDRYPWLTFAPFDWTLAAGPLLYGYVVALTTGRPLRRAALHFLPLVVSLVYALVAFSLPLDRKWAWYTGTHLHVIEPIGLALTMLSVAAYLVASRRQLATYDAWLCEQLSGVEAVRLGWLRLMLAAMAALLVLLGGFAAYHLLVGRLDYFARFPLIVAVGLFVDVLAALGWRYGDMVFPQRDAVWPGDATVPFATDADAPTPAESESMPLGDAGSTPPRYRELAESWAQRLEQEQWYRDESLTLAALAAHVGASERTVSRVLREGLGVSFHRFVNAARVRDVMQRLADGNERADLLAIALDAGFASKASFNRVFREQTGMSPSAWREQQGPR